MPHHHADFDFRRRWQNHLSMNAKSGIWTEEEDRKLLEGYYRFGHQWTQIARYIGNRTDNAVKNRWSVLMRKCNDSDDERAAARGQSAEGLGKKKMKDERAEDNEDAELQRHCKKPCLRISVPSALRSFGTRCCTEPQHNFFFSTTCVIFAQMLTTASCPPKSKSSHLRERKVRACHGRSSHPRSCFQIRKTGPVDLRRHVSGIRSLALRRSRGRVATRSAGSESNLAALEQVQMLRSTNRGKIHA